MFLSKIRNILINIFSIGLEVSCTDIGFGYWVKHKNGFQILDSSIISIGSWVSKIWEFLNQSISSFLGCSSKTIILRISVSLNDYFFFMEKKFSANIFLKGIQINRGNSDSLSNILFRNIILLGQGFEFIVNTCGFFLGQKSSLTDES